MKNGILSLAAISGFIAVTFGAFAAHGLQDQLTLKQLDWIAKGWQYQVFHTLALLGLGFFTALTGKSAQTAAKIIAIFWTIGIIGFSFGLYAMAVTNNTAFAWIVPVGGIAFLIGWGVLIWSSFSRYNKL
ncbi:MAG: DUF423 domain-containing protein [Pasteurellaceae bacterium]|nr:DUF423 domain-containing protein [Pasteurellaceae bacterium]